MKITQDFITAGRRNRPGGVNTMEYITIHNTGNASPGAGAKNHAAYIKGDAAANVPASWHYTVDDKEIYQHLPDGETAYHAGDGAIGPGNNRSIGIEICMNSDGNLDLATDNAAELAAELMRLHRIPIGHVVQHYHWSGKNCPAMIRAGKPFSWERFLELAAEYARVTPPDLDTTLPCDEPSEWAVEVWDWAKGYNLPGGKRLLDGTMPQGPLTREQFAAVMHRIFANQADGWGVK